MAIKDSYDEKKFYNEALDFTTKEARKEANKLFSKLNKRIDRIKSEGVLSPAINALEQKGITRFSSAGKNSEDLSKEWAIAYNFDSLETSTLSGARNFTEHLKELLNGKTDDSDYVSDVFELMHGSAERLAGAIAKNQMGTNEILQEVIREAEGQDLSTLSNAQKDDFISKAVQELTKQISQLHDEARETVEKAAENLSGKMF